MFYKLEKNESGIKKMFDIKNNEGKKQAAEAVKRSLIENLEQK